MNPPSRRRPDRRCEGIPSLSAARQAYLELGAGAGAERGTSNSAHSGTPTGTGEPALELPAAGKPLPGTTVWCSSTTP